MCNQSCRFCLQEIFDVFDIKMHFATEGFLYRFTSRGISFRILICGSSFSFIVAIFVDVMHSLSISFGGEINCPKIKVNDADRPRNWPNYC